MITLTTLEALRFKPYGSAEAMYHNGQIGAETWEEYQWVWRNAVPRLSHLCRGLEGAPAPSAAAQNMLDSFKAVK